MGPRSVERGNVDVHIVFQNGRLLQWGRVRLNAETEGASDQ